MQAPRFLLAPVFALFDFKIYREVQNEKIGTAVLYNLYLSALFCLAAAVLAGIYIPPFMNWLEAKWPAMTLTASGMKLDQPGKIDLVHPQLGLLASFDDSKQTLSSDEMGGAPVFFTATMVYVRNGNEIQTRPLSGKAAKDPSKNTGLHLDGKTLKAYYDKLKLAVGIIFLFVMLIFGFISRLFAGLIFAAVGYLIQLVIPRQLNFESLFTLASFAFSIALIFGIFQYIPHFARFFPPGLGMIMGLVYFGIAIAVQPKPAS